MFKIMYEYQENSGEIHTAFSSTRFERIEIAELAAEMRYGVRTSNVKSIHVVDSNKQSIYKVGD